MSYRHPAMLVILSCLITFPAGAEGQSSGSDVLRILNEAKDYQLRFRDGDLDAAPANVALMEAAIASEPGNADLWHALGLAYVNLAARAPMAGGHPGDAVIALQKGMPAFNRALQINPDHAGALAVRAGMRALVGMQMNSPQLVPQALADMNRAVELAPESAEVRLVRAFGAPVMPEELRNRANEAADLDFLIGLSEWTRAGDFMTVLRADLHFENGEHERARTLYEQIGETGAVSAAQVARSRLSLLPQGRNAMMKDIRAMRAVAGTQCALCHGREITPASAP